MLEQKIKKILIEAGYEGYGLSMDFKRNDVEKLIRFTALNIIRDIEEEHRKRGHSVGGISLTEKTWEDFKKDWRIL